MATKEKDKNVNIRNRKASHEYQFIDTYVAGLKITGTEIKSIRNLNVSLQEAYCYIHKDEIFVKGMHIALYEQGGVYNHEPLRDRKLLLKKREISKIEDKLKDVGLTLIPIRLFINDRGWAKLEIALAKGKKLYDKRQDLKAKDTKRDLQRQGY